jgi:hypothetical protein
MAPPDDITPGSILRELVFNQYQAILAGGAALASLVTLNPLPLLVWVGSELVLLPVLDSGPLRRLVQRRRLAAARLQANDARATLIKSLGTTNQKRYGAMEELCRLIESNYQGLTGISQVYLAEQRGKLDLILQGCLNRMVALERYERMPSLRHPREVEQEIARLERELSQEGLPERAKMALTKNLELKRRLLASYSEIGGTIKALATELDSMAALLEVLHQNSISLRDPQTISEELDTIVRQSEDSERIVREMEALLQSDGAAWGPSLTQPVPAAPASVGGREVSMRKRTRNP